MRFLAVLLALVYPPSSLYSSCLSSQGKVSFDSSDALPWFEHKLFPFQQEGVSRLVSEKRMILADEMGAGKTVQSVVAMNRLLRCGILCSSTFRALIICPKSVVGVWVNELGHWLDDEYASRMDSIHIISAGGPPPLNSLSSKGKIQIINYDVCNKYKNELQSVTFDVLICDEAHYLKSSHTQRTKTIVGIDEPGIQSTYMWLLTGTPILNRPREILPLIWALNREKWPTYDDLERSVFSGADDLLNLRDLKFILRPKILRRKKIDFAQELPPKQISVVILDHSSSIADEEKRFARDKFCQESDSNSTQRSNNQKFPLEAFGETTSSLNHYGVESLTGTDLLKALATIRRFTSTLKLDPAIHLIKKYILTEKVVVFAHHRDLIHGLVESFGDSCVYVHGGLKMESRLHAVAKFQTETTCRIFIGSIRAAGLGINLSVGARVLFLELDYSPSIMTQAEDRCHRFGQKKSVKVRFVTTSFDLKRACLKQTTILYVFSMKR